MIGLYTVPAACYEVNSDLGMSSRRRVIDLRLQKLFAARSYERILSDLSSIVQLVNSPLSHPLPAIEHGSFFSSSQGW